MHKILSLFLIHHDYTLPLGQVRFHICRLVNWTQDTLQCPALRLIYLE